jgi:transcription-repair coupling factor (superfamily II helicase)
MSKKHCRLSGSARALALASLRVEALSERANPLREVLDQPRALGPQGPLLVVVPNRVAGQILLQDLSFFAGLSGADVQSDTGIEVLPFYAWEVLPFDALSPALQISTARFHALHSLMSECCCIVVATVDALMQRVVSPEQMRKSSFRIELSEQIGRDDIAERLKYSGYIRTAIVEGPGEFAVRGSVVDVFPVGALVPVRIETFRHCVESIRCFDLADQHSKRSVNQVTLIPAREIVMPVEAEGEAADASGLGIDEMLNVLRQRASEQHIPLRDLDDLENAFRTDMLWPGIEHICPIFQSGYSQAWEYLPKSAEVVLCDSPEVLESAEKFEVLVAERANKADREGRIHPSLNEAFVSASEFGAWLDSKVQLSLEGMDFIDRKSLAQPEEMSQGRSIVPLDDLRAKLLAARQGEKPFAPLAQAVTSWAGSGSAIAIVASQRQRVQRLAELLTAYEIQSETWEGSFSGWLESLVLSGASSSTVYLLQGQISQGFVSTDHKLSLVFERELFPDWSVRRRVARARNVRRFLGTLSQLQEGDLVVHIDHGVGRYCGLKEIEVNGKKGDFLHLEYAAESKLFLPVENIGKIQKFVGVEGRSPQLHRLGSKTWEQTRQKVKRNVAELAGKLINLYAQRQIADGFSFGRVDTLDDEFADTFSFEPTPDQHQAIAEVLGDMASAKPMDRLVCGDVGYGKTEVALRAAFKAVNAGRQVALLVPTTVLAEQHYAGFKERFEGFPITVGCVSRFFTTKENSATLSDLKAGKVDVIIGTHRLLQKDVLFKDLGLLIIDEEHRFGVASKEKLKEFRKNVDVLALTATPIPRTLHMSLLGIRDLSVIETPPCDRHVIRTYLAPYDKDTVREAILREINRAGQVFYVHNRVQNIMAVADEVAELVPEARFEVAHGQMKEAELSKVMHRFLNREIDVLVCTTIVESGLDIPNANTIIVRNAERFGLAQLYQLRGRVGRSSRRAYAYLMVGGMDRLGIEARKRLEVLQSLDDLGVGFRLALQDMEIRGAGNLLGKDQSGPVNLVGFDLYSQILKEAVQEIAQKDSSMAGVEEPLVPQVEPEIKIGFPAHIPPDYVPDVAERLLLYQKLVALENEAAGRAAIEDIEDRFGRPPEDVYILVELMVFRSLLRCAGIVSADYREPWLHIAFHPDVKIDVEHFMGCLAQSDGRLKLSPSMAVSLNLGNRVVESPNEFTQVLKALLKQLKVPVLESVIVS